jgi:hypothetical protein
MRVRATATRSCTASFSRDVRAVALDRLLADHKHFQRSAWSSGSAISLVTCPLARREWSCDGGSPRLHGEEVADQSGHRSGVEELFVGHCPSARLHEIAVGHRLQPVARGASFEYFRAVLLVLRASRGSALIDRDPSARVREPLAARSSVTGRPLRMAGRGQPLGARREAVSQAGHASRHAGPRGLPRRTRRDAPLPEVRMGVCPNGLHDWDEENRHLCTRASTGGRAKAARWRPGRYSTPCPPTSRCRIQATVRRMRGGRAPSRSLSLHVRPSGGRPMARTHECRLHSQHRAN